MLYSMDKAELKTIQIAIIDDHDLFATGLAALLQSEATIEVTALFDNPASLLNTVPEKVFDIVLLDINMPGMNGMDALPLLLLKQRTEKVIMLSTYNDQHLIDSARKNGAMGYLLKNTQRAELVQAIQQVYQGGTCFPEKKTTYRVSNTQGEEKEPIVRYLSLSLRERELLKYMVAHLTSEQIAEALHISYHTVRVHRKHIMHKLQLKTPAELVTFVMENDLLPS